MIYVLSKDGKPLMPTERFSKVRKLIKTGDAEIIHHKPFTIRLLKSHSDFVQPINLGIDSGYKHIGFSAVSDKKELIGGEVEQRTDIPDLLKTRASHRRIRRSRLRYRKPRFNNRSRNGVKKWYAPSIQHKKEAHEKIISKVIETLPVTSITVETANFDIQKINNPDIKGKDYQEGNQLGLKNANAYVLQRDGYKCQNGECKNTDKLEVHHIIFKSEGGTDKPSNLITLCSKCHKLGHAKKDSFIYKWMKKKKEMKSDNKAETFMSSVHKNMIAELEVKYPNIEIKETYGYITKNNRQAIAEPLEKTHHNDAFVIAGGTTQEKIELINYKHIRRNDRSLTSFKDAKYIDKRDGMEKNGSELNSGRTTRNKKHNTENLRKYRGVKTRKGQQTKTKQQYLIKNGTIIKVNEDWTGKNCSIKKDEIYVAIGHTGKSNIYIKKDNKKLSIPERFVTLVYHQKGLVPQ